MNKTEEQLQLLLKEISDATIQEHSVDLSNNACCFKLINDFGSIEFFDITFEQIFSICYVRNKFKWISGEKEFIKEEGDKTDGILEVSGIRYFPKDKREMGKILSNTVWSDFNANVNFVVYLLHPSRVILIESRNITINGENFIKLT